MSRHVPVLKRRHGDRGEGDAGLQERRRALAAFPPPLHGQRQRPVHQLLLHQVQAEELGPARRQELELCVQVGAEVEQEQHVADQAGDLAPVV